MGDGRFSLFTLELCPAKLNPLGLLLLSALSSPLLSAQLSNRVGGIRFAVVNTDTKLSHRHLLSITINGTVLETKWKWCDYSLSLLNCNNFFAAPIPNVEVYNRFNILFFK